MDDLQGDWQMILLVIAAALVFLGFAHSLITQARVPYGKLILDEASRAGVPHPVAIAQVKVESNFNPRAVGNAGEIGLLQILPAALQEVNQYAGTSYTVQQLTDPRVNLFVGFQYLALQREKYGTLERALAAYNAGNPDSTAGKAYAKRVLDKSKEF